MTLILIMALMFFALICIGVPIAFSMGTASIWYLLTNGTSLSVAAQKFFTQTQSFSFLAVPFFVLAGTLMVEAGIAKKLINFASVLVRHLPAGLGCVSVVTSMILAGISGSVSYTHLDVYKRQVYGRPPLEMAIERGPST